MSEGPPAQDRVVVDLGSRCHRLKQVLSELTALHIRIDLPERQLNPDSETALRLRKAYYHIRAVVGWPVDTLILHVVGPDVRAAQSHLYPIVSRFLHEPTDAGSTTSARRNHKSSRTQLVAFSHPSPQVLYDHGTEADWHQEAPLSACPRSSDCSPSWP